MNNIKHNGCVFDNILEESISSALPLIPLDFLSFAMCDKRLLEKEEDLKVGRLYPQLSHIREVSALIALAVAEVAWNQDLATVSRPNNTLEFVKSKTYQPVYQSYL
jgi:hypothetical protein